MKEKETHNPFLFLKLSPVVTDSGQLNFQAPKSAMHAKQTYISAMAIIAHAQSV